MQAESPARAQGGTNSEKCFFFLTKMYKKKYQRRGKKKVYRRRRQASGWMGTAAKALSIARRVATLVNAESKYYEYSSTGLAPDYNGTILELCKPGQGVTSSQREGDSIKLKNLTFRGQIVIGNTNELVRIIVFKDKENTIASGAAILQGTGTTLAVLGNKNQDSKFDSKVLFDRTYTMDTANTPMIKFNINLKLDFHTNFEAGTQTASQNALKMLIINQSSASGLLVRVDSYVTYLDN